MVDKFGSKTRWCSYLTFPWQDHEENLNLSLTVSSIDHLLSQNDFDVIDPCTSGAGNLITK